MAESRFYYPIVVRRGTGSANLDAPFVIGLPLTPNAFGYACVLADDDGQAQQGLYIWDDKRWRFCLPQRDVSVGVIDGYTITVYYDQTDPITDFPDGTLLFRNGALVPGTPTIEPSRGTIFVTMTPTFGTGSGSVESVNSVLPDSSGNVSINIADIPGLEDALAEAGDVKTVNQIGPDSQGNIELVPNDIGAVSLTQVGAPNGVAGLDVNGQVPLSQLPPLDKAHYQGLYDAATDTPPLPEPSLENEGSYWIVSVAGTVDGVDYLPRDWIISTGVSYAKISNQGGTVVSVNGAAPDGNGNVTVPAATITVPGTVYVPVNGGLTIGPDGELVISDDVINQIGFTPANVLYVSSNGNPATGNGTVNNPFTTISDAVTAASDGTAIIIRSPGTFVENVIIDDKQVALLSETGSAYNNTPAIIEGFLQLGGTKAISIQDLGIRWSGAGAGFRVNQVGNTSGFRIRTLVITTSSAAQAIQVDDSGGAWTGSLIIDGLYTNDGKIQIDAGYTSIHQMPQDSNSIVEVNGGTLDLGSVWRLLRLDHTNGAVYLRDVRMIGSSAAAPAIVSSAPASASNILSLVQVSTWTSATAQSYVNKTGTCAYIVDRLTRNLTSDVWTGTELVIKGTYDRDTIATRAGINYTGAAGTYVSTHLLGIDNALGLRLSTLTSAGGNTLVSNGPSGTLKGLATGTGISMSADANTLTISATGVQSLTSAGGTYSLVSSASGALYGLTAGTNITITQAGGATTISAAGVQSLTSVAGGTSLVQEASGTLKALAEGAGITLTEAGGVITITSSAASGVASVNGLAGAVTLAVGQGISLTPVGQTLTFANTGVLALSSVVSAGSYSLVNTTAGELKNIRPGVGVTMSEAAGVVTINSTGGGGGGVATLNGLQGDVELVPGTNIAINPVGNTLVINSTGGGSGGLSSVTNTTGTDPGLVADDGASTDCNHQAYHCRN